MSTLNSLLNKCFSLIHRLDTTGWAIVAVVVVGLGVLCMRGYGSRDEY